MASIEDILACLGEPEVAQFPDFTQAIRELVEDRNDLLHALRQMVANAEADGKTYRSCYNQAVAAITKAEGR